jgi:hypothetical protein
MIIRSVEWLFNSRCSMNEHKHCDNAATNANSENARSRMEATSARKREYGGQRKMSQVLDAFWAAGFHHVTARSRLAGVLKPMDHLFV